MDAKPVPVPVAALEGLALEALAICGLSPEDARAATEVLVTTDTWGVYTHGTKSLRGYARRLRGGGLNPRGKPAVVREGPAWAVVDGNSSIGMVTAIFAMETAIAKARACGIGFTTVKNSCHFGAAGYYAQLAVHHGMVGQAMASDTASVTAPGSRGPVLGSNPFAFAAPAGEEPPVLLDVSTAAVAGGKIRIAATFGQPIPATWLVDHEGVPTLDPNLYPHQASLTPMAGHKGYGLALMIEVLSGLLSGAALTSAIGSWIDSDPSLPTDHGHAFLALDVGAFFPLDQYKRRMDGLIREIRQAPKAKGQERIWLPGEKEWEARQRALKQGIDLPSDVRDSLAGLVADLGLTAPTWL